jgi:hypothetical protein
MSLFRSDRHPSLRRRCSPWHGGRRPSVRTTPVQAEVEVGPAGDRYEREAHRIATAVMRAVRRPDPGRVQRVILDPSYEDEVFDVEAAKREAETINMNLASRRIGPADPRRQHFETFFGDPAHQKGSRSYPAAGPGGAGPAVAPVRPAQQTTLPDVLVAGPDASMSLRLPGQVGGEHEIEAIYQSYVSRDPTLRVILDPLRTAALRDIEALGERGVRKTTRGSGEAGDDATLTMKVGGIVSNFRADAIREVGRVEWADLRGQSPR